MADLVRRSGDISNYYDYPVVQGSFYKVSTLCLFGIQPLQRLQ